MAIQTQFRAKIQSLILLVIILVGCKSPEDIPDKKWYKGNLHAHSYWSDGNEFPEMIMEWYKQNDYQFTVLSDHNIFQENEKWITLSDQTYLQEAYQNYLKKYGADWVKSRIDTAGKTQVKLKTYAEFNPLFEEKEKFLILKAEEITTGYEGKHIHINASNIQEVIQPLKGNSVTDIIQKNLDAVNAQSKRLNVPIMAHLNHPNFYYSIDADDLFNLNGLNFFEVYNGHPTVNNDGDSIHSSTEKMWDQINVQYLDKQKPLLYGLATDDSHQYHIKDKKYSNAGRGWVMVQADSLDSSSIVDAMKQGQFYSSTGVSLKELNISNGKIEIEIATEEGVEYTIKFIGLKQGDTNTSVFKEIKGHFANYTLNKEDVFVRAMVVSDKTNPNFFDESEFEKAWIQPVVNK